MKYAHRKQSVKGQSKNGKPTSNGWNGTVESTRSIIGWTTTASNSIFSTEQWNMELPSIDISKLNEGDAALVAPCLLKSGKIRRSKPQNAPAKSKYIWRHLVFNVSPIGRHQCMPMTDIFDIGEDGNGGWSYPRAREEAKELDKVVDRAINLVPAMERHGIIRWGVALGMI